MKGAHPETSAPYITRNIAATRQALGLDGVVERNFDYTTTPTDEEEPSEHVLLP